MAKNQLKENTENIDNIEKMKDSASLEFINHMQENKNSNSNITDMHQNPKMSEKIEYLNPATFYLTMLAKKELEKTCKSQYIVSFSEKGVNIKKVLKKTVQKTPDKKVKINNRREYSRITSNVIEVNRKEEDYEKYKIPYENLTEEEQELYDSLVDLEFPMEYNGNERKVYCLRQDCDVVLPSQKRMARHYIIHFPKHKPFKCFKCGKRFSRADNAKSHYVSTCIKRR